MNTLITVQTIFYSLASITMLAMGVLFGIAIYYLIGILRNTRNLSRDINQTYHKTKRTIKNIINSLTKKKK